MDFRCWVWNCCTFRDRVWSNVEALYADFTSWNTPRNLDRETFLALLDQAGVCTETVHGVVWCYGIVLPRYLRGAPTVRRNNSDSKTAGGTASRTRGLSMSYARPKRSLCGPTSMDISTP